MMRAALLCCLLAVVNPRPFVKRTPTFLETEMERRRIACNYCEPVGYIIMTALEENDFFSDADLPTSKYTSFDDKENSKPFFVMHVNDYSKLGCRGEEGDVDCCTLGGQLKDRCCEDNFILKFHDSLQTLDEELGKQRGRCVPFSSKEYVPRLIKIYPELEEN